MFDTKRVNDINPLAFHYLDSRLRPRLIEIDRSTGKISLRHRCALGLLPRVMPTEEGGLT